MKTLKIEQIAMYLPYGLKSANIYVKQFGLTKPLIKDVESFNLTNYIENSTDFKIILKPLKDLINHKKEIDTIMNKDSSDIIEKIISNGVEFNTEYGLTTWLFKNHFDLFNLIDDNLAYDFNYIDEFFKK